MFAMQTGVPELDSQNPGKKPGMVAHVSNLMEVEEISKSLTLLVSEPSQIVDLKVQRETGLKNQGKPGMYI